MIAALWANPLVRKITMYGALAIAVLLIVRWWGNAQYSKGFDKGKVKGVEDSLEQHKKEWEAAQQDLDSLRKGLLTERSALDKDKAAIAQNRAVIVSQLQKGQTVLGEKIESLKPFVANVPASELDNEIRKSLNELR